MVAAKGLALAATAEGGGLEAMVAAKGFAAGLVEDPAPGLLLAPPDFADAVALGLSAGGASALTAPGCASGAIRSTNAAHIDTAALQKCPASN